MRRLSWCAALVLVLAVAGCAGRPAVPEKASVLLVTLDTTRADRLGCYGCAEALTPALDRLASAGVLFENAHTPVPITLPSHASMLTGLLPPEHGLRINGEGALSPAALSLAEVLREQGCRTAAFIAAFVLDSRFGLDQGFEVYDDDVGGDIDPESYLRRQRLGAKVVDAALEWLEAHAGERFFCWVHLFDPHHPYDPHVELFGDRFRESDYDGEIAYVDRQVGRLVRFLRANGLDDRTLVVVVGDHGESLGEHGEATHGNLLYSGALRVPFIFWGRGVRAGSRVRTHVSIADLAPTVLDLLDAGKVGGASSRSLADAVRGRALPEAPCYAESDLPFLEFGWCPLQCLVSEPWKYIRTTRPELYDLAADPGESNNLAPAKPDLLGRMESTLAELERRLVPQGTSPVQLSPDDQRALKSLGYAAGLDSSRRPEPDAVLPDVKDRIHVIDQSNVARELLKHRQTKAALELATKLMAEDPRNAYVRLTYATALGAASRLPEAEKVLRDMRDEKDGSVTTETYLEVSTLLAQCLHEQGRTGEGLAILRELLKIDERNIRVLNGLAWILAARPDAEPGDAEEAVRLAQKVIAIVGTDSPKHMDTAAAAYAAAGRFDEAGAAERKAIEAAVLAGDPAVTAYSARLALYERREPFRENRPPVSPAPQ